ncbi:hypothetical protein GSI_01243 [Ganoderma sinense ZZ0214-1]|uniref:Uncharacterized protein n=1 Tax=Ganoderma sinense ZZ0214-1 TaxID=1077348 RepID=A0A2G8SUU9_9APHY|nr:hypothetical protein GSI_01243 [Ganoderma sinense ZZ0214-1]
MPPPDPRSPSPDPLDLIGYPLPRTPRPRKIVQLEVSDTSPEVRRPYWGPVSRFPSETPSEDADRSSAAPLELPVPSSSPSPDEVDDSPAIRRPWGRFTEGAGPSRLHQPSSAAADSGSDLDDTLPHAFEVGSSPHTPEPGADGGFFTLTALDSALSPSTSEASLPAPDPVSHIDGVGAVVVPFRSEPEFPRPLREAEETLAAQIAAALTNPKDEGLNSETFQTLLEEFLFPRIGAGCNSNNERFKIHQYSQLHAVSCTFKEPPLPIPSGPGKRKRSDVPPTDPDPGMAEILTAVKERRVPDMTSLAMFEDRVPIQGSRAYQLKARKGPKMCITEIKSFDWLDDPDLLIFSLRAVFAKAHYQNYVAAQYLFREDEHLRHVGSFIGAGFAWSFGEFHRSQYPLLYEQPLPITEQEAEDWEESLAVNSPRRKRKKTTRSSKRDGSAYEEDEEDEEEVYAKALGHCPRMPPENTPLEEIFRRFEPPDEELDIIQLINRRKVALIPILDIHGRTYEAFDVIVERMRGWYAPSKKNTDPDHQLVFDADPYERGTCPATVARKRREAAAQD